ncbi:cell surface glycoprotein [Streptomyces goshikiensis]|uniref:zinc finger domain-containing protein n=1 Tax=Streptomyces TaxID=1883 RepID=UPI000C279A33|nr:cell surface glycoprotein [Streptomyces sp. CB02120-2]PJN18905.1 cell surface glycoprotein [Streptomyces sp. CB02120-2]
MNRTETAALLAYAVSLDPRLAPEDQASADERLDQWAELLAAVPATAPHPDGRDWNAAHVVHHHISTSPYRIQPSDVGGPWQAFRRDVLRRHVDPVPAVDPDDGRAYRAALAGTRRAIETGQAAPTTHRELTGPMHQDVADRLAALGSYMPPSVAAQLAPMRRRRAERERLATAGLPDPLSVPCPYETCRARISHPCRSGGKKRHERVTPHPSRLDVAVSHQRSQSAA